MHKNQKLFRNTIFKITKYIKLIPTLFASFYTKTKNRKYTVEQLLTCILKLVKKDIVFVMQQIYYQQKYIIVLKLKA